MPDIKDDILEAIKKVGDKVKHIQDVNDRLEKKYDVLDVDNIKKTSEEAAKAYEDVQKLKQKHDAETEAQKKRIEFLESTLAHNNDQIISDTDEAVKRYRREMNHYLKTRGAMSYDIIEKIATKNTERVVLEDNDIFDVHKKKMISEMSGRKDMTAGVAPESGYFILPDRADGIITRIFETSPVRNVAASYSTISDVFQILRDIGELEAGWVGETETRTATDTNEQSMLSIPIHELYAQPKITQKMIDDAGFDVENWLNGKISSKFGRKENTAWVVGSGNKQPKGFLSYPAWATPGVFQVDAVEQVIATGTAGTLDNADDLIKLQKTLHEAYQVNAVWGMNRKTFGDVISLKDEQGQYLINAQLLRDGAERVLLGNEVIFMADMPDVAADALPVVYADFSEFYAIVDRYGIRVLRDPYTTKPYVKLYTTKRVGGAVQNEEAGKILKINA